VATIFVSTLHGVAARVLLRSGILEPLRAAGVRIVVLAPNADEGYMADELGEGVVVERLDAEPSGSLRSRIWAALVTVRHFVLADGHRSATIEDKYRGFRRTLGAQRPLTARLVHLGLTALWRSRLARRLLLAAEARALDRQPHGKLFERYRPSLVVTGGPGWFMADALVQLEASRRRIPRVGVVLGWDNPTSKGYRGPGADRVVVWSEVMAKQLERFHDLPPEQVFVGGAPHFDHYLRPERLIGRDELLAGYGLDPGNPLIVLATSSPGRYEHSAAIGEHLAEGFPSASVIVRLHPNHLSPLYSVSLDRYRALADRHPNAALDIPEVRSRRLRVDVSPDDPIRLASLLRQADVLVNGFSTTTLEAFLVDTPVVTFTPTAHLVHPSRGRPAERSREAGSDWRSFTHLQGLVHAGATRIASSLPELSAHVQDYLADPALDREARTHIVARELGPTDGRAGERIGRHFLALAGVPEDARLSPTPGAVQT
jgi:hypothetical protein